MAITVPTSQAWATFTADTTVTIPTTQQGDRIWIFAVWKDFAVTAAISGWTELVEVADGAVSTGNGTGSIKVGAWYLDRGGSAPSNPTLDITGAQALIGGVCVVVARKDSGDTWDTPLQTSQAHTLNTTGQSVQAGTELAVPNGSVVFGVLGVRDDSTTFTRDPDEGLSHDPSSGTLIWNGNVVELPATHLNTTTGNDLSGDVVHRFVTTGDTVALRQAAILSASESGIALWVVQSVTSAPATPNLPFSPNVVRQSVNRSFIL